MLIKEIKEIERDLYTQASDKEKLFYSYLTNESNEININLLGEIDRVCYSAFKNEKIEDVDRIIERNKKSKPVAGSHFSNNLISICAFSLCDEEIKKNELVQFYATHGAKEQFIIHKIFEKDFTLNPQQVISKIDILVHNVLIQKKIENGYEQIIAALENCNDLIDLYLIKQSFLYCNEVNPGTLIQNELLNFHNSITKYVSNSVNIFTGIIILGIIPLLYYFIVNYWDLFGLEPHITAISILTPFFLIALFLAFRFKKTWEDILDSLKLRVVKIIYRTLNMDYNKTILVLNKKEN